MRFKKNIIILIIALIFLDQITKLYVVQNLYNLSKELIGNIKLTYVENRGGAFGIAQGKTIGFIFANFIVLGIIIRFLYIQRDKIDFKSKFALIMILSGGLSNLADRIIRGFVVDFIDITHYIKFPIFNIADSYVTIGWILFALFTIFADPISKKIKERTLQIEDKSRCE